MHCHNATAKVVKVITVCDRANESCPGPVCAAEAVERFGDRVFEVIRERPEDLCAIKGITLARARMVHESFA